MSLAIESLPAACPFLPRPTAPSRPRNLVVIDGGARRLRVRLTKRLSAVTDRRAKPKKIRRGAWSVRASFGDKVMLSRAGEVCIVRAPDLLAAVAPARRADLAMALLRLQPQK